MTYEEPANIPVVDLASFHATVDERNSALQSLDEAFKSYGFVYVANHGIPQTMVDEAFVWSKRFFSLPHKVKMRIAHPSSADLGDHRGFTAVGQGYVSQLVFDQKKIQELRRTSPEWKETLEMGNPHPDAGPDLPPNLWLPEEELPGFRAFVERWWEACVQLNHIMLRCCSQALNLPNEDYLSRGQTRNVCHMSWSYYPQIPVGPLQDHSMRRLNAHTDFGQLTLLFQDMVGGLEIHDGRVFRPVIPKPGTVVINVGDLLERQTNGRWKSALHQVVAPRDLMDARRRILSTESVVDRYSLVFFGTPDPDSRVETLPGCETMGRWKPNMVSNGGESMMAAEWIQKRLDFEF